MAYDVFANAVYGVEVSSKWQISLGDDHEQYKLDQEDSPPFDEWWIAQHPAEFEAMKAEHNAPEGVLLHYTGDPNNWAGRRLTEADIYLLGFGVFAFPNPALSKWDGADWHMWVDGG